MLDAAHGGSVLVNGADVAGRLLALEQALMRQLALDPTSTEHATADAEGCRICQGDGQDGVTPVGVDRVGANLVFNSSLHGSVRLNGNNVLEQLQRIETLLAML